MDTVRPRNAQISASYGHMPASPGDVRGALLRAGWTDDDVAHALQLHQGRTALQHTAPSASEPTERPDLDWSLGRHTLVPRGDVRIDAATLDPSAALRERIRKGLHDLLNVGAAIVLAGCVALLVGVVCAFLFGIGPFHTPNDVLA